MPEPADARRIVESGYDAVADGYAALEGVKASWPRMRWLTRLLALVPEGSDVLDVGCGNGMPATRAIAERRRATGIDVSAAQIERARRNVPGARLIHGDVLDVELGDRFDAIAALYVIDHLPRDLHGSVFERLRGWLKPSGYLRFTIEPDDEPGVVGEWLGAPMFFSHFGAEDALALARDAGFEIVDQAAEAQLEGAREVSYLGVLARKPERQSG